RKPAELCADRLVEMNAADVERRVMRRNPAVMGRETPGDGDSERPQPFGPAGRHVDAVGPAAEPVVMEVVAAGHDQPRAREPAGAVKDMAAAENFECADQAFGDVASEQLRRPVVLADDA